MSAAEALAPEQSVDEVAYKQRVDMQNKDVVTAALDEVQASVFSALAQEQPELYRQVAKFIERKKKEGL